MYVPNHFKEERPEVIFEFLRTHPFGLAITVDAGEPFVSHCPFLIEAETRKIYWHLAAANPQTRQLAATGRAKLVFEGPHAYISPTWYAKSNVPTWNFVAVHVAGVVRVLDGPATAQLVDTLVRQYEGPQGLGDFTEAGLYRHLLQAIVGFELTITHCTAKYKLSQNRTVEDQREVSRRLLASDHEHERDLGALMISRMDERGL